jgi:WD40 repeat protein
MRVLGHHADHVYRVRFSPDGRWLASTSDDRTVKLWPLDLPDGEPRERQHPDDEPWTLVGHQDDVEEIAFDRSGRWLASGGEDDAVYVWDLSALGASATPGRTVPGQRLSGHEGAVTQVVFSPVASLLASASRDATVRTWALPEATPRVLRQHALEVWGLAFFPDGRTLASASVDDTVLAWDLHTGRAHALTDHLAGARLLAVSPDGSRIAVTSSSRVVWLCNASDGECRSLQGHDAVTHQIVFSPDGTLLATASGDATLRLWDVETGESHAYRGHRAPVFDVAFSPDGQLLVSGSADADVRTWRVEPPPNPISLPTFLESLTDERLVISR